MKMNKPRRSSIQKIMEQLEEIKTEIECICTDEEEYRDNIPENLQGSEKFENASSACDSLYEAVSNLEDAISNLESATE